MIQSTTKCTHKSISTAFARLPVRDDHGFFDVSVLVEVFPECLVSGVVGEATHEDLRVLGVFLTGDGQDGRSRDRH